jgi:predicted thioesterase
MSDELRAGVSTTVERLIDENQCTTRGEYDIFSTPNLVLLLEETAIAAIAPYLAEGQACVGSQVNIAHSAPTLRGQRVWSTATVTEVDRRRVEFNIEVRDEVDTIATGTHQRFIINLDKFAGNLAAKAEKVKNA